MINISSSDFIYETYEIYVVYFYSDSTKMSILLIISSFNLKLILINNYYQYFLNLYKIFSCYLNKISLFHSLNCYEATQI